MMNQDVAQLPGVFVGEIRGADEEGRALVRLRDGKVRSARSVWMADSPDWSASTGLEVLVSFVDGDEDRPIVVGLLGEPAPTPKPAPTKPEVPEALRIESGRELVIECGRSKIALRADGRIEIRGGHLVSRSSGANKIKGGSVHIN